MRLWAFGFFMLLNIFRRCSWANGRLRTSGTDLRAAIDHCDREIQPVGKSRNFSGYMATAAENYFGLRAESFLSDQGYILFVFQ